METPQSMAGMAERCPKCGLLNRVPSQPDTDAPVELPRAADPSTTVGPANAPRPAPAPMTAEDHPLATQLAAEVVAKNPDHKYSCDRCCRPFPTAGTFGVPSLTCPFCGFTPSEEACKFCLDALAKQRAAAEPVPALVQLAGEMTEDARAAVGSETSAAGIQCRCSSCGAASEAPPSQAGQDLICPACGSPQTNPLASCSDGMHTKPEIERFRDHSASKIAHLCETGEWDGDLALSCLAGTEIIRVVRGKLDCGGAKEISLPELAEVGDILCPDATRVNLPALKKAGNIDCSSAKAIRLPALARAGNINCWGARKINLPMLTEAGKISFGNATGINLPLLAEAGGMWIPEAITINLPALAKAGVIQFANASTVNLPALAKAKNIYFERATSVEFTSLARAGRIECPRATNVNLPALAKAGHMYCPSATTIDLPALAKAGNMFCPRATTINLPVLAEVGEMYFGHATTINLPLLKKAGHLHFPRATTINLPLLVEAGDVFCASAKDINLFMLKKASYIDCPSATSINLPATAKAGEMASRVDRIANLRAKGLEVDDDLPISECARLSVFLDERKRWPNLPKETPLELLRRLCTARWDQVATDNGAGLADLRSLILTLAEVPPPTHRIESPLTERIKHFFTKVVGVTFKNDDGSDRQEFIRQCMVLDALELKHDPDNPFDPNAVAVFRESQQLGHLKRELAPEIVYYVRNGWRVSALVASVQRRGSGARRKAGVNIAVLIGEPSITDAEITAYMEMIAPAIMADGVSHSWDNDDADDG
jgi:hypothetical protein